MNADSVTRWGTILSLLAVIVSLSAFAGGGRPVWWALALDAWAVFAAAIFIVRRAV